MKRRRQPRALLPCPSAGPTRLVVAALAPPSPPAKIHAAPLGHQLPARPPPHHRRSRCEARCRGRAAPPGASPPQPAIAGNPPPRGPASRFDKPGGARGERAARRGRVGEAAMPPEGEKERDRASGGGVEERESRRSSSPTAGLPAPPPAPAKMRARSAARDRRTSRTEPRHTPALGTRLAPCLPALTAPDGEVVVPTAAPSLTPAQEARRAEPSLARADREPLRGRGKASGGRCGEEAGRAIAGTGRDSRGGRW
ncbi:unnamed protein product [Urochloa humidicola]